MSAPPTDPLTYRLGLMLPPGSENLTANFRGDSSRRIILIAYTKWSYGRVMSSATRRHRATFLPIFAVTILFTLSSFSHVAHAVSTQLTSPNPQLDGQFGYSVASG